MDLSRGDSPTTAEETDCSKVIGVGGDAIVDRSTGGRTDGAPGWTEPV